MGAYHACIILVTSALIITIIHHACTCLQTGTWPPPPPGCDVAAAMDRSRAWRALALLSSSLPPASLDEVASSCDGWLATAVGVALAPGARDRTALMAGRCLRHLITAQGEWRDEGTTPASLAGRVAAALRDPAASSAVLLERVRMAAAAARAAAAGEGWGGGGAAAAVGALMRGLLGEGRGWLLLLEENGVD